VSEPTTPLLGVILAGGQSSRMGADKATLSIAGTTLLDFMRVKLLSAGIDEIVICRNAAGYLNDDIPQLGPLGALYTLSQRYPGRRALIVPVDMPLLSVATLKKFQVAVLDSGLNSTIDPALVLPVLDLPAFDLKTDDANLPAKPGRQMFPLYLPFTPAVNAALSRRIKQPDDLSIAAFLRESAGRRLNDFEQSVDDDEFLNANTPQQWQTILAKVQAQKPSTN